MQWLGSLFALRHKSHGHLVELTKGHLPAYLSADQTRPAHTTGPADKFVNILNDASKWGDLLEQLPFFSNTTVASQLLLSSISVLFANPFTIFAAFFVFLSKQ